MDRVIDAADAEESKLGFSLRLYQTLEKLITYLAVKQRNLCITYVRNSK